MVSRVSSSSEIAKGLFLLGPKQISSSYFQCYDQLMERCAQDGEFLSFKTDAEWLSCYEKDSQQLYSRRPLLVFRPHAIANIPSFIQVCHELEIPVTARCGGTGLAAGCVASKEGVILLTGHFKQIKEYDSQKGTLCVEPGVSIRQIKRHIAADFWHFPLSMATEGVAGIAGCLSSNSRGYHQQGKAVFDGIETVLIVDGQGQILEVTGALVCGAEGLWGIIIELNIKLKKKLTERLDFVYFKSWDDVLSKLPNLRSIQVLTEMTWCKDGFYLGLEGESWRLPVARAYLEKHCPGIKQRGGAAELPLPHQSFLPVASSFVVLSSVFHSYQLPEACAWSFNHAQSLGLECLQMADVLAGSLQLILQTKESLNSFQLSVEQFLVAWAGFVDSRQGTLASCHGVGMQMRAFMPPFWSEESQRYWRKLQAIFDPKNLFGRDRFFPEIGKSLERREF